MPLQQEEKEECEDEDEEEEEEENMDKMSTNQHTCGSLIHK